MEGITNLTLTDLVLILVILVVFVLVAFLFVLLKIRQSLADILNALMSQSQKTVEAPAQAAEASRAASDNHKVATLTSKPKQKRTRPAQQTKAGEPK